MIGTDTQSVLKHNYTQARFNYISNCSGKSHLALARGSFCKAEIIIVVTMGLFTEDEQNPLPIDFRLSVGALGSIEDSKRRRLVLLWLIHSFIYLIWGRVPELQARETVQKITNGVSNLVRIVPLS